MSSVYLIRHGQAGLRHDYDTLSELGRRQSYLLGTHLAAEGIRFAAVYTGALQRQRQTAEQIQAAFEDAGVAIAAPQVDPAWNEFDLAAVYAGIAPQLAADDPEFRCAWEALLRESANGNSSVHRRWTQTDIAVVRAWVAGRYAYDGETWPEFRRRVESAWQAVRRHEGPVLVCTSATPIGVWLGMAMKLEDVLILRAAGALYNASFSRFRIRGDELYLSSFNNIPHLAEAALRTYR